MHIEKPQLISDFVNCRQQFTHLRTEWGVRREALISNICSSKTKCDFQMFIMLASIAQPEGP